MFCDKTRLYLNKSSKYLSMLIIALAGIFISVCIALFPSFAYAQNSETELSQTLFNKVVPSQSKAKNIEEIQAYKDGSAVHQVVPANSTTSDPADPDAGSSADPQKQDPQKETNPGSGDSSDGSANKEPQKNPEHIAWYQDPKTERWYFYNQDGTKKTSEWSVIRGQTYYFDELGAMAQSQWITTHSGRYRVNKDGHLLGAGWQYIDGQWYYLNKNAAATASTWLSLGSTWYRFDKDGRMLASEWAYADGNWYYFGSNGAMKRSQWLSRPSGWFYLKSSGAMAASEWIHTSSGWFYLDHQGHMLSSGWFYIDPQWYYFDTNGAMLSAQWIYRSANWYYLNESGHMEYSRWLKDGGNWYYLASQGEMLTGYQGDYLFDPSGRYVGRVSSITSRSSRTPWLIVVNRDGHLVSVFRGHKGSWSLFKSMPCSVGTLSTPTIAGEYEVGYRGYSFNAPLDSGGHVILYYWTQIFQDWLFHSISYFPDGSVFDDRIGADISHGCVRLLIDDARWINSTIPSESKVYIF